ncbi:hypothetical protein [Magnetovibrio sp.]|uniref:hypothetical protein n=1 Tax=Magnetovibrio sp. TaxID=2024836 RepID=UPI002F955B59
MSKKNRPSQIPIYLPEIDLGTEAAFHIPEDESAISVHFSDERHFRLITEAVSRERAMRMLFPINTGLPPYGLMDRLLAKMALEALAYRILSFEHDASIAGGIKEVVLDTQLDELRNFARTGMKPKSWPYHQRRIYDACHAYVEDNGELVQRLHEFDILVTDHSEYFFVIAILGIEFAINFGGPEISGYEKWLSENHYKSPLYAEKTMPKLLLERG